MPWCVSQEQDSIIVLQAATSPMQFKNKAWRGNMTQVAPEMRGTRPHIRLTTCTSLTLAPESGRSWGRGSAGPRD